MIMVVLLYAILWKMNLMIPEGCPVPTQTKITDLQETDNNKDTIKVMTVHTSKGMEFPVMFIIDIIERNFLLYI
jgi:ATP-dependent exoDNAse (exonuclease V) beta subunit